MSIESEVRTKLTGSATVSGLVGAHIYPLKLPQNPAYPAVDYQLVSDVGTPNLGGPSGMDTIRLSFRCWAETHDQARQVGDAIRGVLDGFSGTLTDLYAVILFEQRQPRIYDDTVQKYADIVDFMISYR